jgi:hypothetical protein
VVVIEQLTSLVRAHRQGVELEGHAARIVVAVELAGLKAIPMYNSRHGFGTALAREGVDVRTIQTLMLVHRCRNEAERIARRRTPTTSTLWGLVKDDRDAIDPILLPNATQGGSG